MASETYYARIYRGEGIIDSDRRVFAGVHVDLVETLTIEWARAENKKHPEARPFVRYTIIKQGSGQTLPVVLRTGTVDA